MPSITAHSQQQ